MDTKFSDVDFLQIAEEVQRKGARFYLQAADLFADARLRTLCRELAQRRAEYQQVLAEKRTNVFQHPRVSLGGRTHRELGSGPSSDLDDYIWSHPRVLAGLTVFCTKTDSLRALSGHESRDEILKDAARKTEDIVIFYRGLKDFAHDQTAKATIDWLIQEEVGQPLTVKRIVEQMDHIVNRRRERKHTDVHVRGPRKIRTAEAAKELRERSYADDLLIILAVLFCIVVVAMLFGSAVLWLWPILSHRSVAAE